MSGDDVTLGFHDRAVVWVASTKAIYLAEAKRAIEAIEWTGDRPDLFPGGGDDAAVPDVETLLECALKPAYTSIVGPLVRHWAGIIARVDQLLATEPLPGRCKEQLETERSRLATIDAGEAAFVDSDSAVRAIGRQVEDARAAAAAAAETLGAFAALGAEAAVGQPWAPSDLKDRAARVEEARERAEAVRAQTAALERPTLFGRKKYEERLAELRASEAAALAAEEKAKDEVQRACAEAHDSQRRRLADTSARLAEEARRAERALSEARARARDAWQALSHGREALAARIAELSDEISRRGERRKSLEVVRTRLGKSGGYLIAVGMQPAIDEEHGSADERMHGAATCGLLALVGSEETRPLVRAWVEEALPIFNMTLWAAGSHLPTLLQGSLQAQLVHEGVTRYVGDLLAEPLMPLVLSRGFVIAVADEGDELSHFATSSIMLEHAVNHYDPKALASALVPLAAGARLQARMGRQRVAQALAEKYEFFSSHFLRMVGADEDLRRAVLGYAEKMAALADREDFTLAADGVGTGAFLRAPRAIEGALNLVAHDEALEIAIAVGQRALALGLLESGRANADLRFNEGETLLHRAARQGMVDLFSVLNRRGLGLSATDDRGFTPLDVAISEQVPESVQALVTLGAEGKADRVNLIEAAKSGNPVLVGHLVQRRRSSPSVTDEHGFTPLHWAKNIEVARLLVNAGADVNTMNGRGVTPLLIATANRGYSADHVGLLLECGAEVDVHPPGSETPLFWAVFHGNREIVEVLLKHGADPGKAFSRAAGKSALQIAMEDGHTEIAVMLRAAGA